MDKLLVFSGTQPSGKLTIGNYIGAIRHWIVMQKYYECMYCIADLHLISTVSSSNVYAFRKMSLDTLALYLACGVDPNVSTIFMQSHVPEHTQLNWLLNCCAYYGELSRMTQFKEKSKFKQDSVNVGLFNYPILMAADILLYQTNFVPVGDDQKQHLEFTCNIARRFNNKFGTVFTIPKILVPDFGSRIMSLLNPLKKMSKSDQDSNNYISLLDDATLISKKVKRAITDSDQPPAIYYDPVEKPGVSNLLAILSGIGGESISNLELIFKNKTYSCLKSNLIQSLSTVLKQIQNRYFNERSNENKLNNILCVGAKKARQKANLTLKKVYQLIGL
ncbi:tryptophanyl-tRNA synthetase [Candidatus Blochmanniella vafra str. BVAF]|uniref:Tryptophan--tRNA ligase n=1 Tax=Blochmanniella vafra (strain BVAF) TaxID=859654 RepID=E8Q6I0_BLOVB|nr:tryptophan--tRNA ligase [Candidatus Blochmannia vafer]ADV33949.1 tryptophanyl-tRNA synthetase [Candidatus Blochmannia vafer str. BVAF]